MVDLDPTPTGLVLLTALTGLAITCLYRLAFGTKSLPYPPGPPSSWLGLGQVDLPKPQAYPWITYAKWSKIYGDVIYINAFGNPMLVINSAEAATELLEKRSNNYSSRPIRTMVVELMGWDWIFSSMPYGPWWRRHRTLFHQYFHPNISPTYYPVQIKEMRTMLRSLLETPSDFVQHIKRASSAIVLKISYGHDVVDHDDEYVTAADRASSTIMYAGVFGSFMVDFFPSLKYVPEWMPGAEFKRKAREWKKLTRTMVNRPFEMIQEQLAKGEAPPCFTTFELEKRMSTGLTLEDETLIKNVAAVQYTAGSDTTSIAILSFFLAMTIHPEIQRKAQADIDRVVGPDRLPDFSDRHSLPYIECIVQECLRWNPVTPMSLMHYVSEDDEYNGYHIPKGCSVIPNVWAILHDEKFYPKALEFNPDRFIDAEKNAQEGINKLPGIAFGFGRRACPGRYLAAETIWISIASVLAVYNITKVVDEAGNVVTPKPEYTSSMFSRPKPFQCLIEPRSATAATLIKQSAQDQL